MKTLEQHAKQVWMLPTIEDKKLILMDMVNNFDHKKNIDKFIALITKTNTAKKLDELAANIMLTGSGLKAIR